MSKSEYFDRLVETAGLIARHADYPGKRDVVERCREEIEDLARAGRITADEDEELQEILSGVGHEPACSR
jgi:hypothetical protein